MISPEILKQVRRLQIFTGRAVNELFAGEYESAFKGRGMEFAEVREYQPGDDVRTIDWNVTARAGAPYIKQYVEERELTVMLAVDLSSSGGFGSVGRLKNQLAAEFCAVLAFAATRNNDKVGLLIFTDEIELYIPPKKGTRHVLRLIRELLSFDPDAAKVKGAAAKRAHGETDIAGALDYLAKVTRKRAIIFLVSDFIAEDYERSLNLVNRRHDVVAVSIGDPRESVLPNVGLIELEDAETGERILIDTGSSRVRDGYGQIAARDDQALSDGLRRIGVDRIDISTGKPYVQDLIAFFRRREGRRPS